MRLRFLAKQLAILLAAMSGVMLAVGLWGFAQPLLGFDGESAAARALVLSAVVGLIVGGGLWGATRSEVGNLDRRQALLLVVLSWLSVALLGAAPYLVWAMTEASPDHPFRSPVACVFETMSGLTTTGASVLGDIDAMPRSLLLWRATTHWFGGLGIIVLFVAVLPSLGVGGRRLFGMESPGPQPGGVHPQIRETARGLWIIYSALTAAQIIALMIAGMSLFESTCHAFATLATGGFSTRGASIGAYDPVVHVITTVFMIVAGCNFGLFEPLLRGRYRDVVKDPELRVYLVILIGSAGLLAWWIHGTDIVATDGEVIRATPGVAIREGMFNAAAIQTTTGFGTSDFDLWPSPAKLLLVILMFVGGCAGSTAGGIKVIRVWMALKVLFNEVERVFRPHIVRPVRLGGRAVEDTVRTAAVVYIVGMVLLFVLGAFAVLALQEGADITTAATASVACLCTIGPGLNAVGPVQNYGWMNDSTLATLTILMLMGRLEVLPVLVLAVPSYWRGV